MLKSSAQTLLAFLLIVTQCVMPISAAHKADTITGTLIGDVVDNNDAPMAGVRIVVTNQDTGNQRATITNADGHYQITFLPLGIYTIDASKEGFKVIQPTGQPVKTALNKPTNTAPKIILLPLTAAAPTAAASPTPAPATTPAAAPTAVATKDEVGELTTMTDATRRGNADERQVLLLPLPGVRTFDDLAFLAAGVAPPPQVKGVAGPGIGAGIGTPGQFSVNGQRARSNNFTVDGSDNNDEDVGVRRQGFVSLVPQSIESIKEFQIVTQLWDAELGRNVGSQVNAVSRSGTNQFHGTLYDFFNHDSLNARNFFDYTSDKSQSYPLTAVAKLANGTTQVIPVKLKTAPGDPGTPIVFANPSQGKDQYQRNQGGASIGFPIIKDKTFFFGSFERQDIKARQETHFAVPTVAQRGFLGFGATGFFATDRNGNQQIFFPTFIAGDSVFSLYPFPNNPIGPYGANTFTQVLPADAEGTIFSLKFDHNFTFLGRNVTHTLTGRYNFTDDDRKVPAVGGAIFSGLEPKVRTQNLSLFLNSQLSAHWANQLRGSYGRTRLRFDEVRDASTQSPRFAPKEPFLLNARRLINVSFPTDPTLFGIYQPSSTGFDVESNLGSIGQLIISPFSPVGVDVFLFPQARTNNTYQIADTMTYFRGNHTFKFGTDNRRSQLNSFLNRNTRPQVVFGGTPDLTASFAQAPIPNLSRFGPTPGYFSGTDLASLGIPTGIFQSLALSRPDTAIGLRFTQFNFFFNDNWRVRRGLTIDYGLRYEYNTVPHEVNGRIENTFKLDNLPPVDPTLSIAVPFTNGRVLFSTKQLTDSFNATINSLKSILNGRTEIFDPDRNNVGPHIGFAWDPFAGSSTQAGKTAVRGGFGVYYDVTLGSVVSQSRNVFPNFAPFNVDANTFAYANSQFYNGQSGFTAIFNPLFVPIDIVDSSQKATRYALIQNGQLNLLGVPSGALQPLLGLLFNPSAVGLLPSGGGLAFTLPDRRLSSPYALQFNLQIERELFKDYLVNIAYVGSRGVKLTRFRTPNGGANSPTFPLDPLGLTVGGANLPPALAIPPASNVNTQTAARPIPTLGAFTIFDSSAASNYHSLQASLTKRFSGGREITAAYTWSHAIDDVSDVFDVAGAFTLPQDDRNLRAERGNANFDIRHRFVWSSLSNIPFISRFNNATGAKRFLLGGWQVASITTYQTGQPFTVNTSFDINLDGNLTDRLNSTNGITVSKSDGPQRLVLSGSATSLLAALAQNGQVGRNTFRARGVVKTDFTIIKSFRVTETNSLVFRAEAFNLWNRTHFGIPVRILESPSFGSSVDTSLNPRQIQFALKYIF